MTQPMTQQPAHVWKAGDRCWLECWGEDRPCVIVSLNEPDPPLAYDCEVWMEDVGQRALWRRDRLKLLGTEPTHGET